VVRYRGILSSELKFSVSRIVDHTALHADPEVSQLSDLCTNLDVYRIWGERLLKDQLWVCRIVPNHWGKMLN